MTAAIASAKNRSVGAYFCVGALFPLIGVLLAISASPNTESKEVKLLP